MAEAETTTYDFTEYDKLNAAEAHKFVEAIDDWEQFFAFVDHEKERENPRSTVLTDEVLKAYEDGKKEVADAEAAEAQDDGQDQASETQTETAVVDPDLLADPNDGTDADAIREVPVADQDEPFDEEAALVKAEEQSKHDDHVTALLKERRGYVLYGTDDQVADVDAELDRLGYDGERDKSF